VIQSARIPLLDRRCCHTFRPTVRSYTHTHVYTHTHAYVHTYIHTYIHTHIHRQIILSVVHTCNTHTHQCTHILYTDTHIHRQTQTHTHTHTHKHDPTHTHTHTHIHTHMHTHIHTHIHTVFCPSFRYNMETVYTSLSGVLSNNFNISRTDCLSRVFFRECKPFFTVFLLTEFFAFFVCVCVSVSVFFPDLSIDIVLFTIVQSLSCFFFDSLSCSSDIYIYV